MTFLPFNIYIINIEIPLLDKFLNYIIYYVMRNFAFLGTNVPSNFIYLFLL